jgi:hypothetical protein
MEPGLPTSRATAEDISVFLQAFEVIHSASYFSETSNGTRILTLHFPEDWRDLHISLKYPMASAYPDFDLTIRSAVNTPTLICTKDEAMLKVFLSTAIQMFEPLDRIEWDEVKSLEG